jgi:hypothetical protein
MVNFYTESYSFYLKYLTRSELVSWKVLVEPSVGILYDEKNGCSYLLTFFIDMRGVEFRKSLEVYAKMCLVSLIKGKIVF